MCIIIRNLTGKPVPADIAKRCVEINKDGFGIVYLDGGKGKGSSGDFRTLDMVTAERILTTETRPYIAHCRFATVGKVSADAVHPFPLGKGRYLFQNGTLDVCDTSTCDTVQLAETLHGLSDAKIGFVLQALNDCRFAVANRNNGESSIFGTWHTDKGIEYSKDNVLSDKQSKAYTDWWRDDWGGYYSKEDSYAADEPIDDDSGKHIVAVYGTLKHGHGNHHLVKDADFLGYGFTTQPMRLCVDGLPFLIRGEGKGKEVEVEVYAVDDDQLAALDALEGHPDFYRRETTEIQLDTSTRSDAITAYVYTVGEEYDNGLYHYTY